MLHYNIEVILANPDLPARHRHSSMLTVQRFFTTTTVHGTWIYLIMRLLVPGYWTYCSVILQSLRSHNGESPDVFWCLCICLVHTCMSTGKTRMNGQRYKYTTAPEITDRWFIAINGIYTPSSVRYSESGVKPFPSLSHGGCIGIINLTTEHQNHTYLHINLTK